MGMYLTTLKLRDIFEIHSCYICRKRWSTHRIEALESEMLDMETYHDVHMPQNTEYDKSAVTLATFSEL